MEGLQSYSGAANDISFLPMNHHSLSPQTSARTMFMASPPSFSLTLCGGIPILRFACYTCQLLWY